jgi:glycosidase
MLRFILLFIVFFGLLHSKQYAGNPAPAVFKHVTVPVSQDLRVEPGNWWTGMQHRSVEIMVHRTDVASFSVKLGPTKGVKLLKVEKTDNANYLFLTLDIAKSAKPQTVPLVFTKGTATFTHPYPILARNGGKKAQGVNSSDVIYLIFPDRFSNGDPSNDNVAGMRQGLQRDSLVGRHGGDLQGVINHLDYLQDLGVSTIWLNPELENDQKEASYHGYAVTDHYQVDRRFGSNELLRDLVTNCHQRGMKVVRDVVLNHIGGQHWWMDDLPSQDWLNQWPTFTRTTYRAPTLVDPYASAWDKKQFTDGWFDYSMPDLNQRNPHVASYLIQQAIWWIEYAGIDDLRIDTYTYSDQAFCSRWCKELRDEYPDLGMFGEIWEHGVSIQGFFADDQPLKSAHFDSNLPGVVDFQLCFAIQEALTREQGWTEGAARIYYTLAKDRFYKNPNRNVVMLDNHDFTRFFTTIKEDINKYKSGLAFLLTTRGIPQIYYATEILGTGNEWPSHGNIRKDFPGGWSGDTNNKFTAAGRTPLENEAFNFTRTMLRYRNATPALQTGHLMQFVPVDGVYTYFRYDATKTVMILLNTSNSDKDVDTRRFAERMQGFSRAKNVATGEVISNLTTLSVGKNLPLVLELQ